MVLSPPSSYERMDATLVSPALTHGMKTGMRARTRVYTLSSRIRLASGGASYGQGNLCSSSEPGYARSRATTPAALPRRFNRLSDAVVSSNTLGAHMPGHISALPFLLAKAVGSTLDRLTSVGHAALSRDDTATTPANLPCFTSRASLAKGSRSWIGVLENRASTLPSLSVWASSGQSVWARSAARAAERTARLASARPSPSAICCSALREPRLSIETLNGER